MKEIKEKTKTPSILELGEIEQNNKNYHFDLTLLEKSEIKSLFGLFKADLPTIDRFNTLEEDIALAKRIEAGGEDAKEAREALLFSVIPMIVSEATKRTRDRQTLMDLAQEGVLAVWEKAIDKYEWQRGFRFSTYALWWIKNYIGHAARQEAKIEKVSDSIMIALNKMKKATNDFASKMGREPSVDEISEIMDIKRNKAEEILGLLRQKYVSLSEETISEDGTDIEELIKDPKALYGAELENKIDQKIIVDSYKERINTELGLMSERTAAILKARLGINEGGEWTGKTRTITEISKTTKSYWPDKENISRNRVKQIQTMAISKIKDVEVREVLKSMLEWEN
jgi:RNA polymerase primary sigma factor